MFNYKKVIAPLNITDMDTDLESKTIYLFDYKNSKYKGIDFIQYISSVGLIADISINKNTPYNEKEEILIYYMTYPNYFNIHNLNKTVLDIIFYNKDINLKSNGFLNIDEIKQFSSKYKNLILDWIIFYDSIFFLMFELIKSNTLDTNSIKNNYSQFNENTSLSPNICSLLLENDFWEYYRHGVDSKNKTFFTYYFSNPIYDEKNISYLIINDSNFIWKILYNTFYNDKFQPFFNQWLKQT